MGWCHSTTRLNCHMNYSRACQTLFSDGHMPEILHSDQGWDFESTLLHNTLEVFGVTKSHNSLPPTRWWYGWKVQLLPSSVASCICRERAWVGKVPTVGAVCIQNSNTHIYRSFSIYVDVQKTAQSFLKFFTSSFIWPWDLPSPTPS